MCNNCIHKIVCSKYVATGGVRECGHFKDEKKGEWYWAEDGYCRCSRCHQKAPVIRQYQDEPMTTMTDYCPKCGAGMRGEENEDT